MFILIGIPLFQSFNPAFPLRLNSKLPPPDYSVCRVSPRKKVLTRD